MKHADVLKLLFPIEIIGDFQADIEAEGVQLDAAQASAEDLMGEMFGDAAYRLLADYERVFGLTPGDDDTIQSRRQALLRKMRQLGGLSRAYYISIAAAYGVEITIDEFTPFMCGWSRAGDTLNPDDIIWLWRVNAEEKTGYQFRAGESAAGERLGSWRTGILEDLFEELKPAHTVVIFNYGS